MKLSPSQIDENSLTQFGVEAVNFVENQNFSALAERFGYALAFGRNVEQAIKADFEQCISNADKASIRYSKSIKVKYFQPNDTALYAVVECITTINKNISVSIDLIVVGEDDKFITLEDISYVA